MLLAHPEYPERGVRLAYCTNLHAGEDLEGCLRGLRDTTRPLAERFERESLAEGFGVGLWLPAALATALSTQAGAADLDRLREFLASEGLDPFTYNAFPYGGFHAPGLKEGVFRPTWKAPERLAYTLSTARTALALREPRAGSHVSLSTHTGAFEAWIRGDADRDACADNLARCALHLERMEEQANVRLLLALEPEPRSLAGDTRALPGLFQRILARAQASPGREVAEACVRRHVGSCLDACHAAVEFEEPGEAVRNATSGGMALGKMQVSSALRLVRPGARAAARAELFAMDEPVYLHQVTGRDAEGLVRVDDLPALRAAWDAEAPRWRAAHEWRCHFHVPVDLSALGQAGLETTRAETDAVLERVLASPERWGTDELHLEIETYTWSRLPAAARGEGALVDGLEREYRHVLARLADAGWHPVRRSRNVPPRVDSPTPGP